MSKYVIDGIQMTSLADAVRSATGTSDTYSFDGIVSAVGSMGTGGALGNVLGLYKTNRLPYIEDDTITVLQGYYNGASSVSPTIWCGSSTPITFAQQSLMSYASLTNLISMIGSPFYNCYELETLYAPKLRETGYNAYTSYSTGFTFSGCNKLKNITFHKWFCGNSSSTGAGVNFPASLYTTYGGTYSYTCFSMNGESKYALTFMNSRQQLSQIIDNDIKVIWNGAGFYKSNLTSISVPNVIAIGKYGLCYSNSATMMGITSISLPNVEYLSYRALGLAITTLDLPKIQEWNSPFGQCSYLSYISFNDNCSIMYQLTDSAQYGCKLESFYAPNITKFSSNAFRNLENTLSAWFLQQDWSKIVSIDNNAFQWTQTTSFSFSNVEWLSGAFLYCTHLESIYIPKVKYVGSFTFSSCYSLNNVNIPLCSYIGIQAFTNCSALTSINIENCKTIGSSAFANCSLLSEININNCEVISNYAFSSCNFERFSAPNCINMGQGVLLRNLKIIKDLYIPKAEAMYTAFQSTSIIKAEVSAINESAFNGVKELRKIIVNGEYIKNQAFEGCNNLLQLIFTSNTVMSISASRAFSATPILNSSAYLMYGSIYVPDSMVATYKATSPFTQSYYKDRIAPISSLPILFTIGSGSYNIRQAFPTSITWSDWLSTSFATTYGYYEQNGSIFTSDGTQYISGINTSDLIVEDYEYELANI